MTGHLGAALMAGYFITEQHPELDKRVLAGIASELDRILRGESAFSPRQDAALTVENMFDAYPQEAPQEALIERIVGALAQNISRPRESGHNVIFATIALRALQEHPDLATPPVIDGVVNLIAGFNHVSPGSGYYGKLRGRIDGSRIVIPDEPTFPAYTDLKQMADTVLSRLIESAAERRVGYGGLVHIINHAAALVELARCGYAELANQGMLAHHQHVRLWKTLPNVVDELGLERPVENDFRTPDFWQSNQLGHDNARLDHRIKTIYGFSTLITILDDAPKIEMAYEKLRYLL
jgi:hypothetical protein